MATPSTSAARRGAATLVLAQGVLLGLAGVLLGVRALGPGTADVVGTELLALLAVATGTTLVWVSRAVGQGRPWVRGPVVVVEVICVPIGITLVQNGRWYVGVPIVAVAVAVVALLARAGLLAPVQE